MQGKLSDSIDHTSADSSAASSGDIHWREFIAENLVYLALLQAGIATLGSLYFSEVMDLVPCVLCWYQRILMYPLALIIAVGILRGDRRIYLYVLPLAVVGLTVAIYHNLLYFGVLPESVQPCMLGVSCTTKQIEWLGFITIPLMSLTAFTVIDTIMLAQLMRVRRSE